MFGAAHALSIAIENLRADGPIIGEPIVKSA